MLKVLLIILVADVLIDLTIIVTCVFFRHRLKHGLRRLISIVNNWLYNTNDTECCGKCHGCDEGYEDEDDEYPDDDEEVEVGESDFFKGD